MPINRLTFPATFLRSSIECDSPKTTADSQPKTNDGRIQGLPSEMVAFQGEWSIEQIEEIIKLRYQTFGKAFSKSSENDEELWGKLTAQWNKMQEYEVFNSKQVKHKLCKLYKEYSDIQAVLDVFYYFYNLLGLSRKGN